MVGGPLVWRERRIVLVCAGLAVLSVLGMWLLSRFLIGHIAAFQYGNVAFWAIAAGRQVPSALALVAVVLTGRPFVAVGIAAMAALLAVLVGALGLLDSGIAIEPTVYVSWAGGALVGAAPLLAADLVALRRGRFTSASGGATGLLVGVLAAGIGAFSLLAGSGRAGFDLLSGVLGFMTIVLPIATFALTGLVAGRFAERTGQGARTPSTPPSAQQARRGPTEG